MRRQGEGLAQAFLFSQASEEDRGADRHEANRAFRFFIPHLSASFWYNTFQVVLDRKDLKEK